jgi:DNA-binding XRE family transcriptional regulator
MNSLGDVLQTARRGAGMTQDDLASAAGVTRRFGDDLKPG